MDAMKELRRAIRAAVRQKLQSGREFSGKEIIEELQAADPHRVTAALAAMLGDEVEALNDDLRTERIVARDSSLTPEMLASFRDVSAVLGARSGFY
jgi:hypothetical protein